MTTRLYQGVITTRRPGGGLRNQHHIGLYGCESDALADMARATAEARPGESVVAAACYVVPDDLVLRAAEELGCVQIYDAPR